MKGLQRSLASLCVVLTVVGLAVVFLLPELLRGKVSSSRELMPGDVAPSFTLADVQNTPHSLQDYFSRHDFVLLHFWATWCPTCNEEMPSVVRIYHELGQSKVELVAISTDQDPNDVRRYMQRNALPFPVLVDARNAVMERYNVSYLPTTFLIRKDGRIVARNIEISQLANLPELQAIEPAR